jgi:hypothetical protein
MNGEDPREFDGESEANLEHALHVAAERAATFARENGLNYSGKEFQIVGSSIVLSNPHIKEFKVRISG